MVNLAKDKINFNSELEILHTQNAITNIKDLFKIVKEFRASDLHIQVGSSPIIRIAGNLKKLDHPPISFEVMEKFIAEIIPPEKIQVLKNAGDLDYAYGLPGEGRMRINLFYQRGSISMACRLVNTIIPTFEELHLPIPAFQKMANLEQGLVIFAGITGSGKSTSLASIIDHINRMRDCHIITIEDPIEYLHKNKKSYVTQREIGIDVASYPTALKYAMRQDPDVILIGEMRDPETVSFGLSAAETGHLVFTTLHASSASQSIGRMLDFFPSDQQTQIRQSLQFNLKAIVCQKLISSVTIESKQVPAVEIMFSNTTVRELIRKGDDIKLINAIRQGKEDFMQDFNASLKHLVEKKYITEDIALSMSPYPDALKMNLRGIYLSDDRAIF